MKRRKYSEKEQDDLQRLKRENDKLKRQVSSLRKQIARVDIDRYENLQDLIQKFDKQELEESLERQRESQRKKWKCYKCEEGILKLMILERLDGIHYYRKCDDSDCTNKTKLKKWKEGIEGAE